MSSDTIPAVCPGVCSGIDPQPTDTQFLARNQVTGGGRNQAALQRVDQDLHVGMLGDHVLELGHVVVMVVGQQDVRELVVAPLDQLEQWRDWATGVDQHRCRAMLIYHQIGVRQPGLAH